jgi:hypothetical protein
MLKGIGIEARHSEEEILVIYKYPVNKEMFTE